MHEHIARVLYYAATHLFFASTVCIFAWALTSIPCGRAAVKYWICVAASFNLFLPVGAILDKSFAASLGWAKPLGLIGGLANQLVRNEWLATFCAAVWLIGTGLMVTRLVMRLRRERNTVDSREIPMVNGILRPRILMPEGIERLLTARELNAVLLHERTHVSRRDNLVRLIYEIGLCCMWFHPLVWLMGARLALYRELSCDEAAIENGHGRDLVGALTKFAGVECCLLQASFSSQMSQRLTRLAEAPDSISHSAGRSLAIVFTLALVAGLFETVAHTACCFVPK